MPLFGTRGAASVTGFGGLAKLGYLLRNSLRFRKSNSAYLSRTMGSTSTTYTISVWVKRGLLSGYQYIFASGPNTASDDKGIAFDTSTNQIYAWNGSGQALSTAVFRDPAAWYHVVMSVNSGTATVYVNNVNTGISQTSMALGTNGRIGRFNDSSSANDFDGYMAEFNLIDGQALTPSSFGKTDGATGQWIPIKFGGAYGTAGFYLNFTDASAATAAAIGKDSSGNGNNWTPNNISVTAGATYDSMTDVPTLTSATVANYATLNPLSMAANLVLNSGNLAVSNSNGADTHRIVRAGIGMTTGKWYWEVHVNNSANVDIVGLADDTTGNAGNNYLGGSGKSAGWGYNTSTGSWYQGPWTVNSPTPPAFPSSGIIGVAYDADAGNLWFSSNGSWLSANGGTGNPAAGSNPNLSLANTAGTPFYPALSIYSNGGTWTFNFGQRPFAYTSNLSGFKSLNAFNLP